MPYSEAWYAYLSSRRWDRWRKPCGKARTNVTSLSPAGAARRVHGESTRAHDLSRRVAHCRGGDDQPTWPSASDPELVPVRRQGVDTYHPQGSAEIPQPATGSSHFRVHL